MSYYFISDNGDVEGPFKTEGSAKKAASDHSNRFLTNVTIVKAIARGKFDPSVQWDKVK